ncbi:PRC-barrel domain-containing protein [Jannaschia formosa]|uniref:PRC-barrel domain-containing protein n=1 Tax=Jannaschia formosa TaxID=2259592 RepID=UPI000E1C0568|nr:PRC-barrel domain-containing protein [Jannaschia formosa]TFL19186.1 hypothetical protein DR046_04455 [Jannaschia formosa]
MKTYSTLLSGIAAAALISGAAFAQTADSQVETGDGDLAAQSEDGTLILRNRGSDVAEGELETEETIVPDAATLETVPAGEDEEDGAMAAGTEAVEEGSDAGADGPAMAEGGDAEATTVAPETGMAAGSGDAATGDGAEADTAVAGDAEAPAGEGLYGAFANMRVSDLVGMNVLGGTGERLGEVDRLVDVGGTPNAIVGVGGFLGFGERDIAIPLDRFSQTEEGLRLDALTEEELEAMPEWDESGEEMPAEMTVGEAL